MSMPNDENEFTDNRGSYSPSEDGHPVRLIPPKATKDIAVFESDAYARVRRPQHQPHSESAWSRMQSRVESFQHYLSRTCCSFLSGVPAVVLILCFILLVILLILAGAILFGFLYTSRQSIETLSAVSMQRTQPRWPRVDNQPSNTAAISARSLFPPNISVCDGFGFSCTLSPSVIIGSSQVCDGVDDCPDGSDESSCNEVCQTAFGCPRGSSKKCLRGRKLCDGVNDCSDGSDESIFCRSECLEGELKCEGVSMCVPKEFMCDGDAHCPFGDDEASCVGHCQKGAVWCAPSKRCIPSWQRCDGTANCPGGIDEQECSCKECSGSGRALCNSTKICIDRSRICDGVADCPDGEDENMCPGSCPIKTSTKDSGMVLCNDGRRYHDKHACSGLLSQCDGKCFKCNEEIAFTCSNGQCIPRAMACDGFNDCADATDEKFCDCALLAKDRDVMQCKTLTTGGIVKCIPQSSQCDGYPDCPDGEDEKDCDDCSRNPDAIFCNATRTCLSSIKRCDGVDDCGDSFDELHCTCEECSRQPHPMYMCTNSDRCFPRELVCDPKSRCPRAGSLDKLFCANRARLHF